MACLTVHWSRRANRAGWASFDRTARCVLMLAALLATLSTGEETARGDLAWAMFRGPNGSATATDAHVPMEWSSDKNLAWQVELPGRGSSSPIVWSDHVYITCYQGYGEDPGNPGQANNLTRTLLCLNRKDGTEVWRQNVKSSADEDPFEGFITDHGYASSTPVTDGERIFAFFGKTGVVAFDMQGNQLWQSSVGTESDSAKWGGGSSPILCNDLVIVNAGNEGSAIVALRKSDGSVAWKYQEPQSKNSWSTPVVVELESGPELVVSVPGKIVALNPVDGKELWYCESPIEQTVVPSAIAKDGIVYSMGSRAGRAIAVRCGGRGDVSESHVIWKESMQAGIGTPVIMGDRMYWTSMGLLLSVDLATGKDLQRQRLPDAPNAGASEGRRFGSSYASPIALGPSLVVLLRNGVTYVYGTQPKLTWQATNAFAGDKGPFDGTPAVAEGQMFVRSANKLYCIGENSP